MKAKLALSILLVAVLALFGTGCNKVTGGGSFNDFRHGKVTFGFNAQPTGVEIDSDLPPPYNSWVTGAKGQFQLVAHGTKTRIHGSFDGTWKLPTDNISTFFGTCTVNGTSVQPFSVQFFDNGEQGLNKGDGIIINLGTSLPAGGYIFSGNLTGGNIKIHKSKEKK